MATGWSSTQAPPHLRHQQLGPQFIKKQLIASPPAQVLWFLSLLSDCRAVIRVCLMRFSWRGYGLLPYLPIRQRLCHSSRWPRKFFWLFSPQYKLDRDWDIPQHSQAPARSLHIASTPSLFFFPHSTKIKKQSIS